MIIKKLMMDDKKLSLPVAVKMATWTHNTNVNVLGYTPLQLMTGKSVVLPGLVTGNLATESLYDDETVRMIMERHSEVMKGFREVEFSKKLERAANVRSKGYEDLVLKEGDLMYYQHGGKKAWLGPERIASLMYNSLLIHANGGIRKMPKCNVQLQLEETS